MADGGNFYSKIRKLNAGDGVGARGVDANRAIMLVPLHAGGSDAVKAEFTTYNPIEQRDVGGRYLPSGATGSDVVRIFGATASEGVQVLPIQVRGLTFSNAFDVFILN